MFSHLHSEPEKWIIRDEERLKTVIGSLKALGVRIVLTQGSYDLVHIGHARYLNAAKQHGDVLIVGVDEDVKIQRRKGPDRPIVPEDERMEMVLHIRPVDIVVLKRAAHPKWHLIKTVQPDTLIATQETYSEDEIRALQEHCGKVVVMDRQATTSTSAKIRLLQIKTASRLEEKLSSHVSQAIQNALSEQTDV